MEAPDEATRPAFRPRAGRARLSRRHLDALAETWEGAEPAPELVTLGAADGRGPLPAAVRLAATWSDTRARVLLIRAGGGRRPAVEVRWSPAGVVALPAAPAAAPVDVAALPATGLARSLWCLLRLGPRRQHQSTGPAVDVGALTRPFETGAQAPWLTALGVTADRAVLSRAELRLVGDETGVPIGVLDDGDRIWEVRGGHGRDPALLPTDPGALLRTLAGWQERLLVHHAGLADPGRHDPALLTETSRRVVAAGTAVDVPMPDRWRALVAPPRPTAAWYDPDSGGFAVNVTVTSAGASPEGRAVAEGLCHGRVVDEPAPDVAVLLHRGPVTDVVTVQRTLPTPRGPTIVAYTCAVHQARLWLPRLTAWAGGARPTPRRETA